MMNFYKKRMEMEMKKECSQDPVKVLLSLKNTKEKKEEERQRVKFYLE